MLEYKSETDRSRVKLGRKTKKAKQEKIKKAKQEKIDKANVMQGNEREGNNGQVAQRRH
jgi:hypothetical protein